MSKLSNPGPSSTGIRLRKRSLKPRGAYKYYNSNRSFTLFVKILFGSLSIVRHLAKLAGTYQNPAMLKIEPKEFALLLFLFLCFAIC